jgi:hypothetical protein
MVGQPADPDPPMVTMPIVAPSVGQHRRDTGRQARAHHPHQRRYARATQWLEGVEDPAGPARWPRMGACLMPAYGLCSRAICYGPFLRELPGRRPATVCHGPPVRA